MGNFERKHSKGPLIANSRKIISQQTRRSPESDSATGSDKELCQALFSGGRGERGDLTSGEKCGLSNKEQSKI